MQENENCGTCIFWKHLEKLNKKDQHFGLCIFNPPELSPTKQIGNSVGDPYHFGEWPVTEESSVCGKWLKRKEGHVGFVQ